MEKHNYENAPFWSVVCLIIAILLLALFGCTPTKVSDIQEEKEYISINGEDVEFVIDEYENPYLRYAIHGQSVYIPFPFETAEEEPIYKPPTFTNYDKSSLLSKRRKRALSQFNYTSGETF